MLVDLKPAGQHYMEDFFAAGGIGAVLRELKPLLHLDCLTVTGETLGERLDAPAGAGSTARHRSRSTSRLQPQGGLVALFGSLAPDGAILKRSAADPTLFENEGRAVVFTSLEDSAARIDDPDLDVTADDILVLQNAGPQARSAMPEAGYLPIPKKLARAGVKDMVRISDARMSGTAYGTDRAARRAGGGGRRAARAGAQRRPHPPVASRSAGSTCWSTTPSWPKRKRAWQAARVARRRAATRKLYQDHVLQAEHGCDFDFLRKA